MNYCTKHNAYVLTCLQVFNRATRLYSSRDTMVSSIFFLSFLTVENICFRVASFFSSLLNIRMLISVAYMCSITHLSYFCITSVSRLLLSLWWRSWIWASRLWHSFISCPPKWKSVPSSPKFLLGILDNIIVSFRNKNHTIFGRQSTDAEPVAFQRVEPPNHGLWRCLDGRVQVVEFPVSHFRAPAFWIVFPSRSPRPLCQMKAEISFPLWAHHQFCQRRPIPIRNSLCSQIFFYYLRRWCQFF